MNLQHLSAEFGITLSDQQIAQFAHYQQLLIDWNGRMNLTRIIEPDQIMLRHFLDSLTCATVTGDLNAATVIDVGTGAGFPGLPLKILYPTMQLTLVDSVAKKTRFLQVVVDELGLENVQVVAERAETLGQSAEFRAQYGWVVARALAHLPVLAEYLLPLLRVGGSMLVQKGASAQREISEAAHALDILGGNAPTLTEIRLPQQPTAHYLIHIIKSAETPAKYPRRVGKPSKRPL